MKIGVLGHSGFVGRNLMAYLLENDYSVVGGSRRSEPSIDATKLDDLIKWVHFNKITHIVNLAALCGGIGRNQDQPFELWWATSQISTNVLRVAQLRLGVQKVIMTGTVCSYGENNPVPFKEEHLMATGAPEPTNRAYGVSKLSALYGAQALHKQIGMDVVNLVPVNMYGEFDHFDYEWSHVIPAMIRKMDDSPEEVTLWGDGSPTREFLYARDFAQCVEKALWSKSEEVNSGTFINVGSGSEISIFDLAHAIAEELNWAGKINWDVSKPNGQMRRCLDVSRAENLLGFKAETPFSVGLRNTIDWYKKNESKQVPQAR